MGLVFQMFVYPPSPPIAQSASDVAVCLDKLRFFSKSRVRSQKYFFKETRICVDQFHTFTRVREYRTLVVKF